MINPDLAHLSYQQTIASPIVFVGIGLHSGRRSTMRIHPAESNHGILIIRRDLPAEENHFRVHWESVVDTTLCATIGNEYGHRVATVEHLLSAFSALGLDNALIELDGPEIPVMDGSAAPFVSALANGGIKCLDTLREVIVIRRPVRLQQGESCAELLPDVMQRITVSIDFNQQDIGIQSLSFCLSPATYASEIAPARTFGFAEQLAWLRRRGLARGGSIENAIPPREGRVANMEGLRFRDEFVRHKALDAIGDLSLAGAPIIGHYRGNRPGHRLNLELLTLLMSDREAWVRVPADQAISVIAEQPGRRTARAGNYGKYVGGHTDWRGTANTPGRKPMSAGILSLFANDSR